MKKTMRFLSMVALAMVGAVTTGCSSDDNTIEQPQQPENPSNTVTLTTTVSMDDGTTTRALTSAGVKTFAAGETMAVVYKNTSGNTVKAVSSALTAGDIAGGSKSATFTFTLTAPDKAQSVTYIYPAAMANADGTPNYAALATQNGTLATLSSTLDYCTKSGAWNGDNLPLLTLENQLAILAITLKNGDGSSNITSSITGLTLSDGTNSYTVTRSATAGPIYVAIRPTASADIDITATNGSTRYAKALTSETYAAGNGYSISWRMLPEGALPGKFTVNGSGKKVYFSKGNLQATTADLGTNWTWAFAENQWDYIGGRSNNGSEPETANNYITGPGIVSANGTVDLFGWSTSDNTYGISNSETGSDYSGDLVDWGATIGAGWYTLSGDEWTYVINTRASGSTVFGTSNARYTYATINTDGTGVNGMILFPDGVTIDNSEVSTAGTVNYGPPDWNQCTAQCTTAQWTALESKGCVFLPVAGMRFGANVTTSDSNYWSSTPYGEYGTQAYYLWFNSHSLDPVMHSGRHLGKSVRLVRPAE